MRQISALWQVVSHQLSLTQSYLLSPH